jgi:hypothetical protein
MRYCHPQGILNNQYKCIVERRAIHRALLLVADGYIHGFVRQQPDCLHTVAADAVDSTFRRGAVHLVKLAAANVQAPHQN